LVGGDGLNCGAGRRGNCIRPSLEIAALVRFACGDLNVKNDTKDVVNRGVLLVSGLETAVAGARRHGRVPNVSLPAVAA